MRCVRAFETGPFVLAPRIAKENARRRDAIERLSRLVRCNALFALCEISKGVVIVGLGDFATADVVGEFLSSALPSATPLALTLTVAATKLDRASPVKA